MKKNIPLSVPSFDEKELEYVEEAIKTNWVSTAGRFVSEFEENISKYLNVSNAVACQNGTAGLHLALDILGVKEDIEVIVPTITFIAAVNPVKYLGGNPIFMDCDETLNMDLDKLEKFCQNECKIVENKLINLNTDCEIKAIVIVHIFGNLVNMDKLMKIADKYNLKVVEDATEALGSHFEKGRFKNKFAGTIGDFGVYSFNGNKIITTGGGGMIVAKKESDLKKAKYLSTQAKDDPLFYCHNEIGYNYRMTNLQAAIGIAQLKKLESYINIKEKNYFKYNEAIKNIEGLYLIPFNDNSRPNYWFYSLMVDKQVFGIDRNGLMKLLKEYGIQSRPLWSLIHKQKPYRNNQAYSINKAIYYEKNLLNIPCSSSLKFEDIDYIVQVLNKIRKNKE